MDATYKVAAALSPDATDVSPGLIERLAPDLDVVDRRAVLLMLGALKPHRNTSTAAHTMLAGLSLPTNTAIVDKARLAWLAGQAEAQRRAALADHPDETATGFPLIGLLDDALIARIRGEMAAATATASLAMTAAALTPFAELPTAQPTPDERARPASNIIAIDSPFLTQETRLLNEVVEATIAAIQRSGDWNADVAQRRRVIYSFVWTSGNKRLCDYRPGDSEHYERTLRQLPRKFRWGDYVKKTGNLGRDFDEVMLETAGSTGAERHHRTVNRDLTTLARFERELRKVAWKPPRTGVPCFSPMLSLPGKRGAASNAPISSST